MLDSCFSSYLGDKIFFPSACLNCVSFVCLCLKVLMAGRGTGLSAPWWAWWGKAVDHTPSHVPKAPSPKRENEDCVGRVPCLCSSPSCSFSPALVGLLQPRSHPKKDLLWWSSSQALHSWPPLHVRDLLGTLCSMLEMRVWAPLHLLTRAGTCVPPRMRVSLYSTPKVPRCQELLLILICNALLTPHSWSPRPLWAFIQISLPP